VATFWIVALQINDLRYRPPLNHEISANGESFILSNPLFLGCGWPRCAFSRQAKPVALNCSFPMLLMPARKFSKRGLAKRSETDYSSSLFCGRRLDGGR